MMPGEKPGKYPTNPIGPERMNPGRGAPGPMPVPVTPRGEPVPAPPTPAGVPFPGKR
jgi:hypothetical protein